MDMRENLVGWFEIPVTDMERAANFYNSVFDLKIEVQNFGGVLMGWFPFNEERPGASGSLIQQESYIPSSKEGVLIYFSSEDVNNELSRVEAAHGTILQQKTQISPEVGYMALFLDTEGNRIALHSRN